MMRIRQAIRLSTTARCGSQPLTITCGSQVSLAGLLSTHNEQLFLGGQQGIMDFDKVVSVVRYTLTGAAALWGRIPELTQLLLLLMAIDILMGLVVAVQSKDLRPDKAWRGVTKKLGALALIGVMA